MTNSNIEHATPEKIYMLPIWETITTSWTKMYGSKATIWAALIINIAVLIAFFILNLITKNIGPLNFVIVLINNIVSILFVAGIIYLAIRHVSNLPIDYSMMFRAFDTTIAINLVLVSIFEFLILCIPVFILFLAVMLAKLTLPFAGFFSFIIGVFAIIAILYLYYRLVPAIGFVIDKNQGPIEAIRSSFLATRFNVLRLFVIHIISMLILFISIIPLGIGLIWTIPLLFTIYAVIYKRLLFNVPGMLPSTSTMSQ